MKHADKISKDADAQGRKMARSTFLTTSLGGFVFMAVILGLLNIIAPIGITNLEQSYDARLTGHAFFISKDVVLPILRFIASPYSFVLALLLALFIGHCTASTEGDAAKLSHKLNTLIPYDHSNPPDEALSSIVDALTNDDPQVTLAALDMLALMGKRAKQALPALVAYMTPETNDYHCARALVTAAKIAPEAQELNAMVGILIDKPFEFPGIQFLADAMRAMGYHARRYEAEFTAILNRFEAQVNSPQARRDLLHDERMKVLNLAKSTLHECVAMKPAL